MVVVHYLSMQLVMTGTPEAILRSQNISMGALAVALLGVFLLSARRHQFEASLGGVAVTCLGFFYIFFMF